MRLLANRGMYEEAWEWVRLFGPYDIDAKTLLKLGSRLLELTQTEDDPLMTGVLFMWCRRVNMMTIFCII